MACVAPGWPLLLAAVVSAALAGVAGSLYAHYTRFVSPEVFLFTYTVTMVIMVIAGGQGTINVNSWSPDSTRFAFVTYEPLARR